ncbi:hypothetical protein JCM3774_004909 [Rhodotorula dairenensis]
MFNAASKCLAIRSPLIRISGNRRGFFMPPAYPAHPYTLPPYEPPHIARPERPGEAGTAASSPNGDSTVNGMSEETRHGIAAEPCILMDKHTAMQLLECSSARTQVAVTVDDPLGLTAKSWIDAWLRGLFPEASVQGTGAPETHYELRKEEWSDTWAATDTEPVSP